MRNDEIAAIESFSEHLLSKGIKVEPWEEGEDPPDFYLMVESERFAVEVTNLIDEIKVNDKSVPRLAYSISVDRLVSEIEQESHKKGNLKGSYQLWVDGPFEDFFKVKKHIKSESLTFLEDTKDLSPELGKYLLAADDTGAILKTDFPEEPPELLQGAGAVFCFISKKHGSADRVFPLKTSPKWLDWEADLAQEACGLLQAAISTKCHKLKNVATKKILLLPDLSRFMTLELYRRCVGKLHGLNNFHAVYLGDVKGVRIGIHGPW